VYNVVHRLSNGSAACATFHYSTFLLGELVKILTQHGIIWRQVAETFRKLGFENIVMSLGRLIPHKHREGKHREKNAVGRTSKQIGSMVLNMRMI
jgi:hypothetical protein